MLPPEAVPAPAGTTSFSSYTAWPCGPIATLKGYWKVPGMGLPDVANWLQEHPPGNLMSTRHTPVPDNPDSTSTAIGFIPAEGAQQGIVYTIEKMPDGVAVRAEIAAQTSTATCPPLPGNGQYGAPGQG